MATSTTTSITESEYLFQEKSLRLAQKFYSINDISLLKTGMFGYTTALNAHAMRDSAFHRDVLFNEFFLINANLNGTLYNWAKTLNYDISLAVPSKMPIAIKLPVNEIEKIATDSSSGNATKTFTISKDIKFDVSGYSFLLPYDLVINFYRSTSSKLAVNAYYDFESYSYKPISIQTPYLKSFVSTEGGVDYITISAEIYQLTKQDFIFTISSNDILDAGIIEVNYGSNIASFQASYNANNTTTSSYSDLELIFNEIDQPTTSQYCYYTFVGDDTLRIYFSSESAGFRPDYNSKVKISVYTTKAEEGNFSYSGSINIKDTRLDNITVKVSATTGKSTGGEAIKSFQETKLALIQQLRTRDNYTTTYDLETYFDKFKRENLSSNSEYQIVKLRDDIFRRQFTLYVLGKNSDGVTIPTNTVDLEFSLSELENMNYSIKPGTLVIYDRVTSKYRLLSDDEYPDVYLSNNDNFIYAIPFLMNIDFKEFPKTNVYHTNYDKSITTEYNSYNIRSPYQAIINTIDIARNPLTDINDFTVSCNVNTDSADPANLKVRALIYDGTVLKGYFDLTREDKTTVFSAKVNTEDTFTSDGYYIIKDFIINPDNFTTYEDFPIETTYTIRLAVLINDTTIDAAKTGTVYERMTDLNNYAFICDVDGIDKISFADDLSDIMYHETIIDTSTGKISISKVPVIGALFYMNQFQNNEIMNDFVDNLTAIRSVTAQLENNTSIDTKFFNSYGVSRYFSSDTIDLRIKMSIALTTTATEAIDKEIKAEVVSFIEACNNQSDKRFSISNMITHLETNFSTIRFIKFFSVNGANIQNIEKTAYTSAKTENLPYDYVPEYLTVTKVLPSINTTQDFDYGIDITYI